MVWLAQQSGLVRLIGEWDEWNFTPFPPGAPDGWGVAFTCQKRCFLCFCVFMLLCVLCFRSSFYNVIYFRDFRGNSTPIRRHPGSSLRQLIERLVIHPLCFHAISCFRRLRGTMAPAPLLLRSILLFNVWTKETKCHDLKARVRTF